MLDVFKCKYEECYYNQEAESKTYYFTYPTDMSLAQFDVEPGAKIVGMCVSLTLTPDWAVELAVSPTVETEDGLLDVDWQPIYPWLHNTYSGVLYLISLAENHEVIKSVLPCVLEDDGAPNGGTSFVGETVHDFIRSTGETFYSLEELNAALAACGIKPVSPK